jgi:hypothetical protein
VPLTSCLSGLDKSVLQIKTKIVSIHTADFKPVKQEVNSTVKLPPFSIPWLEVHLKIVSLRIVSEVDGLVDGQVRRSLVGGRRLRRQEVVDRVVVRPAP